MLPAAAGFVLETLPGWPAVHEPSVLELLTVTLFIPLGVAAVLFTLILGPSWRADE